MLGVVSGIALARAYGIDIIGEFALAYAPVLLVGTLSTMQEQAALVREIAVLPRRAPRILALFLPVLAFSFALTVVVGAAAAVIAYALFAGPVGRPELFEPMLVLLASNVLLANTSWNLDMVLATFRAGRQLFWIRLLNAVVLLGGGLALSVALDSLWGLVVAQVAADAATLLVRLVVVRGYMSRASRQELRDGFASMPQILRFGARVAPGFAAGGLGHEATTWILGITSSVAAVGAWTRVWQLARRLLEPTFRVAEVLYPTLVERRARGDRVGFDRALLESTRLVAGALLLPAAAVGGAAHAFLDLYGPGFDVAADALAIVLVVPALYCVITLQSTVLMAVDRPGLSSWITGVQALLIVALGIPLTLWLGVTGAALAQLGAYVVDVVWRTAAVSRHLSPGALGRVVRPAIATLLAYAAGFAAARLVDLTIDGTVALLAALPAGALAFVAVLVICGGLTADDRDRLSALRARYRRSPPVMTAAAAPDRP